MNCSNYLTEMKIFFLISILVCVFADDLKLDLVSDYTVNDCLKLNNEDRKNYFSLDTNGFPYCAKYTEDLDCDPEGENTCAPGLKCGDRSETCEVDTKSCFKYFVSVGGKDVSKLLWTPNCTADGSWAPKQCKGGSGGRCFCYDRKGTRLFGNAFQEQSADMTCACSRKKAELLDSSNEHKRSYVSFHCDSKGNFEKLQCDSGHCWCADPKTGEPTSVIVPEKTMKFLECFETLKGDQYLRKCESIAYAQAKIIEIMSKRGVVSPHIKLAYCENDGGYGPYTKENSMVYCVSNTNTKSAFHSEIAQGVPDPDCNCAHDQELYKKLGKSFNLKCSENGNYQTFQKEAEEKYGFCVDKDGNKLVDRINIAKKCDPYSDYL